MEIVCVRIFFRKLLPKAPFFPLVVLGYNFCFLYCDIVLFVGISFYYYKSCFILKYFVEIPCIYQNSPICFKGSYVLFHYRQAPLLAIPEIQGLSIIHLFFSNSSSFQLTNLLGNYCRI